jgi:hypothetical protein
LRAKAAGEALAYAHSLDALGHQFNEARDFPPKKDIRPTLSSLTGTIFQRYMGEQVSVEPKESHNSLDILSQPSFNNSQEAGVRADIVRYSQLYWDSGTPKLKRKAES